MRSIIVLFLFVLYCSNSIAQKTSVQTLISNFDGNGAISVDNQGNIYISEYGQWSGVQGNGTRVFKLNHQGKVLDTIHSLKSPMGTAVDRSGNFYVNNDNNMQRGEVLRISPSGERKVIATIEGWPSGMNIDDDDNLYITNYNKGVVHRVSGKGNVTVLAEDERLLGCTGVDFVSSGEVVVSNFTTAKVYKINLSGEVVELAHIPDITIQNFGIGYITVYKDTIFATGIAVGKLFAIGLDGSVKEVAGSSERNSKDGDGQLAAFNGPNGIRADKKNGILYISEYGGSKKIRKIKLE